MKLLLIALTLAAPAFASNSNGFLAAFGPKHDAASVMNQLTGMMGNAQQKLSLAERHHKKVVKKVRNQAAAFLKEEATAYGKYMSTYSADLAQVAQELQDTVTLAKAGLAKAEAATANTNDWKDPEVEQRAKLGAQVAAADRTIKRAERRRERAVREAEERAEETLEDEAQKLGMKVGDMTPLVDEAKKTLETVAEKQSPVLAAAKTAAKSDKKVDLKALQNDVTKANAKNLKATADANKRLDAFLTKTDKDVVDKVAKIQGDLEVAQKAEIAKVLGRKVGEPVKKAAPVKKTAAKAAPVKAAPVKLAVKAAPVKAAPVKAAPVKAAPVKLAVKAAPVKAAPVKAAPVKAAPVKAAPVKAAPAKAEAAPAKATAVKK